MPTLKARVAGEWVPINGLVAPPASLPTLRLYLTAHQSIASGESYACSWTEGGSSDPQGVMELTTPTRLQVNRSGHYLLSYVHRWSALPSIIAHSEARVNSAESNVSGGRLFLGQSITGNAAAGARFGTSSKVLWLDAGDYVNIFALHADTVPRQLDGAGESNTSCQLVALVGPKGDTGSGSTVTVQDNGVAIGTRPTINFTERIAAADDPANDRILVAADTGLLYYYGGWTSVRIWQNRDVAQRFGALWVWESATADPAGSAGPGTNVANWRLLGGTPNMTAAEITAWTTMTAGCSVFNRDTNRLNVWDDNVWRPSYPLSYGNQFALATVAAGTNDATVRTLFTSSPLTYGGLLTVNGRVDVTLAGSGTTEMRVEGVLLRASVSIGTVATSAARITVGTVGSYSIPFNWQWYDARPADEVQVTIKRQSGTMTYGCTITTSNWHGIQIIEQPN